MLASSRRQFAQASNDQEDKRLQLVQTSAAVDLYTPIANRRFINHDEILRFLKQPVRRISISWHRESLISRAVIPVELLDLR